MGLGIYRLLLAYFVVASHLGINLGTHFGIDIDINPGVAAVVCFYALSGFVMAALVDRYHKSFQQAGSFYLDRALRIVPQLWFYLIIGFGAVACNLIPQTQWLSDCTGGRIGANFFVFPFHFQWINDLSGCMPIPPAWSLGVEAMFYLMVPFLFAFSLRGASMAVSIGIFVLAYFGVIGTEFQFHGFRWITGTLFIFLCGSYLFTRKSRFELVMPWVIFAGALAGLVGTFAFPSLNAPWSRSVFAGIAVAVPALYFLGFRTSSKWDSLAGDVSYGVFLNHFLVIWAIAGLQLEPRFILVAILSTGAAACSVLLIERPIQTIRRSRRTRKLNAPAGAGTSTPLSPHPELQQLSASTGA